MSTYVFKVKWPGDGSYTDLTTVADRDYSYDFYSGGKDFKFVKNTMDLEVVYSSALALKMLSLTPSDLVPAYVDKDGVRLFTGYLIAIDGQGYSSWKRTTIPMTLQDPSLALDTALTADMVLFDHWLSAPSATAYSLLHKLFPLASATVSYNPPNMGQGTRVGGVFNPVTNNALPLFIANAGDNLLTVLTNLLWQQGWRWWFDKDGVAQFAAWTAATGSSVTFNVSNENVIDGSFRIEKTQFVEDSVEVAYTTQGIANGVGSTGEGWAAYRDGSVTTLYLGEPTTKFSEYKDFTYAPSVTKHITIYSPKSAGSKTILTWAIPGLRFNVSEWYNNHYLQTDFFEDRNQRRWVDFNTSTLAVTTTPIDAGASTPGFTITNFSMVNGTINFDLTTPAGPKRAIVIMVPYLTATYHGETLKATSYGTRRTGPKKYTVDLPTVKDMADNLAGYIRQQIVALPQVYNITSRQDYALGAGATVDIGGITASGIIFRKAYAEKRREYTYKVKQLTAATTGTSTIVLPTTTEQSSLPTLYPVPTVEVSTVQPETVAATPQPKGTPTIGDLMIYMGLDPRRPEDQTRLYEFALKQYVGNGGGGEEWMNHLVTRFLANGMLALALSGCVQAPSVLTNPGKAWKLVANPPLSTTQYAHPLALAYINNVVVVGTRNGYSSRSTNKGTSWEAAILAHDSGQNLNCMAVGNGILIAGCSDGKILKSTTNGASWIKKTCFNTAEQIYSVVHISGSTWAAGGVGGVSISTDDGDTWGARSSVGDTVWRMALHGGALWAIGGTTKNVYKSTNYTSWSSEYDATAYGSPRDIKAENGIIVLITGGYVIVSKNNGASWTATLLTTYGGGLAEALLFHNNTWVIGGIGGTFVLSYDNGETWKEPAVTSSYMMTSGVIANVNAMVSAQDTVVVGGNSSTSYPAVLLSKELEAGAGIVERGDTATWHYRKFSDGTMEQWGVTALQTTSTLLGGAFYYSPLVTVTFPVSFIEAPNVEPSCVQNAGMPWMGNHRSVTSSGFVASIMGAGPTESGYISWRAVGRFA